MTDLGVQLLTILRTLVEISWMFLLAQGVLFVIAGPGLEHNFVYRLIQVITKPAIRTVRCAVPGAFNEKYIPFITFFLLFWLWIALAWIKQQI